jgi:hypothetical protein
MYTLMGMHTQILTSGVETLVEYIISNSILIQKAQQRSRTDKNYSYERVPMRSEVGADADLGAVLRRSNN